MQAKILQELLQDLENELCRLGYTEATLKYYRNRWQKLLQFADERNELYFTEQLGIDFIENRFHIMEDFSKVLSQKDTQELRVIRMIGDFQLHNSILRRYYKHEEIITNPYFIDVSSKFKSYCYRRDYSKVTVGHYVKQTEYFMDYLISQGIADCHDINISLINGYIRTLAGYTYKTVEQNICSIRSFLRYLYEEGILSYDLASKTVSYQIASVEKG